jgi:hypothetical protein
METSFNFSYFSLLFHIVAERVFCGGTTKRPVFASGFAYTFFRGAHFWVQNVKFVGAPEKHWSYLMLFPAHVVELK